MISVSAHPLVEKEFEIVFQEQSGFSLIFGEAPQCDLLFLVAIGATVRGTAHDRDVPRVRGLELPGQPNICCLASSVR